MEVYYDGTEKDLNRYNKSNHTDQDKKFLDSETYASIIADITLYHAAEIKRNETINKDMVFINLETGVIIPVVDILNYPDQYEDFYIHSCRYGDFSDKKLIGFNLFKLKKKFRYIKCDHYDFNIKYNKLLYKPINVMSIANSTFDGEKFNELIQNTYQIGYEDFYNVKIGKDLDTEDSVGSTKVGIHEFLINKFREEGTFEINSVYIGDVILARVATKSKEVKE